MISSLRDGRLKRLLLAGVALSVLFDAGCGRELDIKPQDPGALTRGLKRSDGYDPTLYEDGGPSLLPENEFVNLPATSAPDNWLKFSVRRFTEHTAAIDPASISIGGDGITRYSLVIRSSKGVDNVTFEGIRCSTKEWKMYATGRPNGAWSRVPSPVWRPLGQTGLNSVRQTLFDEFVCERDGATPQTPQAVVTRIKKDNDGLLSKPRT